MKSYTKFAMLAAMMSGAMGSTGQPMDFEERKQFPDRQQLKEREWENLKKKGFKEYREANFIILARSEKDLLKKISKLEKKTIQEILDTPTVRIV